MKHFIKNVEDFTCEHCKAEVKGSGYTNHCPKCLRSKHVDLFPGDRLNRCQGMMKPIRVENKGFDYFIIHQCVVCDFEKRNLVLPNDDFDVLAEVAKNRKVK